MRPFRKRLQLGLLFAVCTSGGCAGPLSGWQTARGPRLVVRVHNSPAEAVDLTLEFEELDAALGQALFPTVAPVQTEIVVFNDGEDQKRAVAAAMEAGGTPADRDRPVTLTLENPGTRRGRPANISQESSAHQQKAARALAGLYLDERVPHCPAWLRAGVLNYAETVSVNDGTVELGRRLPYPVQELHKGHIVLLSDLLDMPASNYQGLARRSYDASAWAFVHYLLNADHGGHGNQWSVLLDALAKDPKDSHAAVAAAFPGVSLSDLETKVRDYAANKLGRQPTVPVREQRFTRPARTEIAVAPATAAEIGAAVGALAPETRRRK